MGGGYRFTKFTRVFNLFYLLFNSVRMTELQRIWERTANSAFLMLYCCFLRYVCLSFALMFRISFGL